MEKKKETMKQKMWDIIVAISWADIARTYFGKPSSWLYDKLEGRVTGGQQAGFTPEEAEQLRGALCDLADRIRRAADKI